MTGMWYLAWASRMMGAAWAQAGHSMSTNSQMATLAPAGGLSMVVSLKVWGAGACGFEVMNWPNAVALRSVAARVRASERERIISIVTFQRGKGSAGVA